MSHELDPVFGASLRAALIGRVATRRSRWHVSRRTSIAIVLVGGITLGGSAALALSGALPGAPIVTHHGRSVPGTYTGDATIELGARPADATEVSIQFTCIDPGTFTFSDGSSLVCDERDAIHSVDAAALTTTYEVPLGPGETSTSVTVTPEEATWRAIATYASTADSAWAANANGQTYGVENSHGRPDLIAIWADNGQQGYAFATDLYPQAGGPATGDIPVYLSDGTTVVGTFTAGMGGAQLPDRK